jgi:hypothetical protein
MTQLMFTIGGTVTAHYSLRVQFSITQITTSRSTHRRGLVSCLRVPLCINRTEKYLAAHPLVTSGCAAYDAGA